MVGFAPRAAIDGPDRLPMPFGLFSVASLAETATERWENGVNWEAVMCGDPLNVLVSDCDPGAAEGFPKQFPDGPGTGEADPFTVYGTYKCSGPQAVAVAQDKAREVLDLGEEKAVERRLWSKIDDAPEVLTASDPLVAVARLEKWLADNYGSLGVIHMSRAAATVAAKRAAFRKEGNRLVTALGTPVVAGSGYPGTGVAGAAAAADTEFVAATPAIFGYRSEVFEQTDRPGDLMDRTNNDMFGIAERTYLVGMDPCGVAFVQMNLLA